MRGCAIILATLAFAAPAIAFELKGYSLGAPMEECPAGVAKVVNEGATKLCVFDTPNTIANQPTKSFGLTIGEGKLVAVQFNLVDRGAYANIAVRDALIEKYGRPTESKSHINKATWLAGGKGLVFDGWAGTVLIMDFESYRRLKQDGAKKDKADL